LEGDVAVLATGTSADVRHQGGRRISIVGVLAAMLILGWPARADATVASEVDERRAALRRLSGIVVTDAPQGFERKPSFDGTFDEGLAVAQMHAFVANSGPPGVLSVAVWDPGPTTGSPDFTAEALATPSPNGQQFDARGINRRAQGVQEPEEIDGEPWMAHLTFVTHGGLVIQVTHEAPRAAAVPTDIVESRLHALMAAQLAQPTLAPARPKVPDDARYLDEWLLDDPGVAPGGHTFHLLPRMSGVVSGELYARLGADAVVLDQLPAFEDQARGMVGSWADPVGGVEVAIHLFDLGDVRAAAAFLDGAKSGISTEGDRVQVIADDAQRWLATGHGADGLSFVSAVGRRGQTVLVVATAGNTDRDTLEAVTTQIFGRQQSALPADDLPADPADPATAAGFVIGAICLPALARIVVRRIRRRRVRMPQLLEVPPRVIRVTDDAGRLRLHGTIIGTVLFVSVGAVVCGLVPLLWPAGFVSVAVGLMAAVVVMALRRRVERRGRARPIRPWRPRMFVAGATGAVSVVMTLASIVMLVASITMSLLRPSSALQDIERGTSAELATLFQSMTPIAFGLAFAAMVVLRQARRQSRLHAAEVRRLDRRAPVLYLRGFTDDRLRVLSIVSGRRPTFEQLTPAVRDRFEAVVVWELDAVGPTVAIAPPGTGLASLGAAREYAPDADKWLDHVCEEIDKAALIVVSLGRSDGVLAELAAIRDQRATNRTLLVFPPVGDDELRERWRAASSHLVPLPRARFADRSSRHPCRLHRQRPDDRRHGRRSRRGGVSRRHRGSPA
jgi:MFS family permease